MDTFHPVVMPARRQLDNIETLTSQTLINSENSHEDFTTVINKQENYRRQIENIRMIKSQKVILRKKNNSRRQKNFNQSHN